MLRNSKSHRRSPRRKSKSRRRSPRRKSKLRRRYPRRKSKSRRRSPRRKSKLHRRSPIRKINKNRAMLSLHKKQKNEPTYYCVICLENKKYDDKEGVFRPGRCILTKKVAGEPHKICGNCWWGKFALEGANHNCPGCVIESTEEIALSDVPAISFEHDDEVQILDTPPKKVKKVKEVIDLTLF